MSLQCVITDCKRPADVLCYCCQENLCRNHYNEHDYLNSRLNLLADEIDTFDRQLLGVDLRKYTQTTNDRLQSWRLEAYKVIDHYCEQKYRDVEHYLMKIINQKREGIEHIRTNMLDIVQKRQMTVDLIDSLRSNLHTIENEINDIDRKYLSISTSTLILDTNLVRVEEFSSEQFDLSSLSTATKTIDYTRKGFYPIASNEQCLLMYREPNLCLIDRNFKLIKQLLWTHGPITDVCWSSGLNHFFLLTRNQIYVLDVSNMLIERVETTQKLLCLSCTCSETSLFLSTSGKGASICEFNILNSLQAAKRWDPPDSCSIDERIHDISYNKGTLLVMIENPSTERIRLELRSTVRFDRLWMLQLDIEYQSKIIRSCLLHHDQWLIADSNTSRLLQVTKDGKLKSSCYYNPIPCGACIFGDDLLAVSTLHGIHLHKI
jgi:hypothetical protein